MVFSSMCVSLTTTNLCAACKLENNSSIVCIVELCLFIHYFFSWAKGVRIVGIEG